MPELMPISLPIRWQKFLPGTYQLVVTGSPSALYAPAV
jgi:hypothetical protein